MGGPVEQNLPDERQPFEKVPSLRIHQQPMDVVSGTFRTDTSAALIERFNFSCKSPNELAPGCREVSRTDGNYHMTLDPERDLQRIHSLIYAHLERFEKAIQLLRDKPTQEPIMKVLEQLREVAYQIEQQHRSYKRKQDRNTKYGSLYVVNQLFLIVPYNEYYFL